MLDKRIPLKTKVALGVAGWANNLLILLNTTFCYIFIRM